MARLLLLLVFPLPVYAHGQDVIATIFYQIVTVLAIFLVLAVVPVLRRHFIVVFLGCLLGVITAWLITGDMPYTANRSLITSLDIAMPIGFTIAAVLLTKRRSGNLAHGNT